MSYQYVCIIQLRRAPTTMTAPSCGGARIAVHLLLCILYTVYCILNTRAAAPVSLHRRHADQVQVQDGAVTVCDQHRARVQLRDHPRDETGSYLLRSRSQERCGNGYELMTPWLVTTYAPCGCTFAVDMLAYSTPYYITQHYRIVWLRRG